MFFRNVFENSQGSNNKSNSISVIIKNIDFNLNNLFLCNIYMCILIEKFTLNFHNLKIISFCYIFARLKYVIELFCFKQQINF